MPFLASPMRFLLHYVAIRPYSFLLLTMIVIGGSASAVGVQYAMKMLIDAMTGPGHTLAHVHWALAAFVALVVLENAFVRLSAVKAGRFNGYGRCRPKDWTCPTLCKTADSVSCSAYALTRP